MFQISKGKRHKGNATKDIQHSGPAIDTSRKVMTQVTEHNSYQGLNDYARIISTVF